MSTADKIVNGSSGAMSKIAYLLIGAFSLVTALAWNSAVQNLFEEMFPGDEIREVYAKFIYAILITIVAGAFVVILSYFSG